MNENAELEERTSLSPGVPRQEEMPYAMVHGDPVTELPRDLYIPPHALEVFLEAFEGPLDLLLYHQTTKSGHIVYSHFRNHSTVHGVH